VSRSRPYHLTQDKVERALRLVDYNVRCLQDYSRPRPCWRDADAWSHLQGNMRLLAEEPSTFLNGDGRLHSAAVYLLHQIDEIRYRSSPASLAKTWVRLGPRLTQALYEFLFQRDAPDAERARAVRRERRRQAGPQLKKGNAVRLTRAAEQRQRIIDYAHKMVEESVPKRDIASCISRKSDVKVRPDRIRTILHENKIL
jgi:hypothetical protein